MNCVDFEFASLPLSLTFALNLSIINLQLVIRSSAKAERPGAVVVRPNRSYRTDEKTARLVDRSERALVLGTREFARFSEEKSGETTKRHVTRVACI